MTSRRLRIGVATLTSTQTCSRSSPLFQSSSSQSPYPSSTYNPTFSLWCYRSRGLHSSACCCAREEDHYTVLGVPNTVDPATLKSRFYALSKELHPDRNPGDEAATSKFQAVSAAYSLLSDPASRREYDAKRRRATGESRRPAAPRGSYYSPGRRGHSDSDLNATRRPRAKHAWDSQAQARAQRTRERTEASAKAAAAGAENGSGKGKGFGWGTGGVYEGRGVFSDDDAASSRFEELTERERKMDVRLKARLRAAAANAARRDEVLNRNGGVFNPENSSGIWYVPGSTPAGHYQSTRFQREEARESEKLFKRTQETREQRAAEWRDAAGWTQSSPMWSAPPPSTEVRSRRLHTVFAAVLAAGTSYMIISRWG